MVELTGENNDDGGSFATKKTHAEHVAFACSVRARLKGLLGTQGYDKTLVLAPCCDVHTWGMHYPIDVAFVSEDGEVLAAYRAVAPRRRLACPQACVVLEREACGHAWYEPGNRIGLTAV